MPHIVKISQRRKGSGAQVRFQSRSFIDSDTSEKVDGMRRIQWTACVGFGGRHASDSVDGMRRITHITGIFGGSSWLSPEILRSR